MAFGRFTIRTGTLAQWTALNPILEQGEQAHITPDSPGGESGYKIGDGVTAFNNLPLIAADGGSGGLDAEAVQDVVGAMLVAGTGIDLNYSDATNTLTITSTAAGGGLDTEAVQDTVAAMLTAGTGVTLNYDDGAGTLTITATAGGGTTDPEIVRDVVGAALVAGTGVSVTVDDAGDTITLAVAGVPISAVSGLQTALDGKAATTHTHDDRYYTEGEVDTALSGKASTSHTHGVTDLTATGTRSATTYLRGDGAWATPASGLDAEAVQDTVAAMLVEGTGIDLTYNDTAGTLTIRSIASTPEVTTLYYNGTSWINADGGTVTTTRPTAKRVLAFGGATQPTFLVAGDVWVKDNA